MGAFNSDLLDRQTVAKVESLLRAKFGAQIKRASSKRGLELRICCPFCTSKGQTRDNGYKLWINPGMGVYRCWRCETRGSISNLLGTPIQQTSGTLPDANALNVIAPCDKLPGELVRLDHLDNEHVASRYMIHRGFNPSALGQYYGVSYCASGRPFGGFSCGFNTTNTIVFPLWMSGKLVGWQARLLYNPESLDDEDCEAFGFSWDNDRQKWIRPPKYFTSPGLTKGAVLYNFDMAVKSELVVVTEGPTDVLASGPCAVGTLGKGVSATQISLLSSHWRYIVILLDPDAGQEAQQLAAELRKYTSNAIPVQLEGYDDPGSAPTRAIWAQICKALESRNINMANINLGPHWCEEITRK